MLVQFLLRDWLDKFEVDAVASIIHFVVILNNSRFDGSVYSLPRSLSLKQKEERISVTPRSRHCLKFHNTESRKLIASEQTGKFILLNANTISHTEYQRHRRAGRKNFDAKSGFARIFDRLWRELRMHSINRFVRRKRSKCTKKG